MKCEKYYIFGFIPMLYREKYKDYTIWKLLKFFPLLKIQTNVITQADRKNKHTEQSEQSDMYYDTA